MGFSKEIEQLAPFKFASAYSINTSSLDDFLSANASEATAASTMKLASAKIDAKQ